jgi:hypothetical protein
MLIISFQKKSEKERLAVWQDVGYIYSAHAEKDYPTIFSQCSSTNKQKKDIFTSVINESVSLNRPIKKCFEIIEEKLR